MIALDLFGFPIDARRGLRGRPRHVPTEERREIVRTMRAAGCLQPEIAEALGITGPTLRLHYHRELGSRSQTWRHHAETEGGSNEYED